MNYLLKSEAAKTENSSITSNNTSVEAKNKTATAANPTPAVEKPAPDPERSKSIKTTLKWTLIIVLFGAFIFMLWWFSTPHYTAIKQINSVSVKKEDQKTLMVVKNEKSTYTCDISSFSFEYYISDSAKSIYTFYANSNEYGKIAANVIDYPTASVKIDVSGGPVDVVKHQMKIADFSLWYAYSPKKDDDDKDKVNVYKSEDGSNWVIVDAQEYKDFYNKIDYSMSYASIPSDKNAFTYFLNLLPTLLLVGVFVWYLTKMTKLQGGDGESIWSVGKSQAKLAKSKVMFSDVAGLKEEKAELIEVVDYLKNPNKYAAMGARAPKGVILYGPPGTGKTLLAKATAGEAKVPFYQISGSNFEDMLVGVGAKRVRDLFNNAKKTAPSIIFIDEFDSVAAKRGKMDIAGGNAGIADQTINQLLAEMDGFDTKAGIVVMAATNRLDVLDDAILRPGRFDRHIQVNLPDIKEREEILKIHARNKNISSKVSLNDIARRTPGFSGAQLENVLNEATLLTVRYGKLAVGMAEIDEAIDRVIAGPAKHTRVITEEEKRQIAYHEAGHALVGLNLPGSDVVEKITIIPRGQAAGYTLSTPEKQEISIQKKSDLLAIIASTLGGRAAEEIVYGSNSVSTGASNDLYKVTRIVRSMVTQLGMSDIGMTQFVPSEGMVNPYSKDYSEATAQKIDGKIEAIIQEEYKHAKDIISANRQELDLIVTSLLTLETIVKNQIDYIHKNKKLPAEVIEKQEQIKKEKEKAKEEVKKEETKAQSDAKEEKVDDKTKPTKHS